MGNRAVIRFHGVPGIGIYLHWNGGRASVAGFLQATKEQCGNNSDRQVNIARLFENIGLFFPGCLSFYADTPSKLDQDNYDNGVYIINPDNLEIIGRRFLNGGEEIDQGKTDAIADLIKRKRIAADSVHE